MKASEKKRQKERRKARARRRRRPDADQLKLLSTRRLRMSEVISHVAEPLIDRFGQTPEDLERTISLATLAWNLTLLPSDRKTQEVDRVAREIFPGDQQGMALVRFVCDVVAERKRQLYPGLHKVLILDVRFRREADNSVYFEVEYSYNKPAPG